MLACVLLGAGVASGAPRAVGAPPASVRLAPATPGAVRFTVNVPVPNFVLIEAENGVQRLELAGYDPAGLPGTPAIPTRQLLVAVPPLGAVRRTAVACEWTTRYEVTL